MVERELGCFRYHKGTDFQANHNQIANFNYYRQVVLDTTKVQIFKQITTATGKNLPTPVVVLDTTKVQIFKQITTYIQQYNNYTSCFRYHKGTDFQANHNKSGYQDAGLSVVLDTTKVQIFKQITTGIGGLLKTPMLF